MKSFDEEWMARWANIVNSDDELALMGKYLEGTLLVEFGDEKYLLHFRDGRWADMRRQHSGEKWDVAFIAPKDSWEKFATDPPPPGFTDLFAMSHPPEASLKLEGNLKFFWQNVRAIARVFEDMRRIGV